MIKIIKCFFGKHHYYQVEILSPWAVKLGCKYCLKLFAYHKPSRIILRWDSSFEDFYNRPTWKKLNGLLGEQHE